MSGNAALCGGCATLRLVRRVLGGDFARRLAPLGPGRGSIRAAAGWNGGRLVWRNWDGASFVAWIYPRSIFAGTR